MVSTKPSNGKYKIPPFKDGANNYYKLFFIFFCVQLTADNYTSYGLIQNPLDNIFTFFRFLRENWPIMAFIFIGCRIQILVCFIIEKCLSLNFVEENLGMILHGCNAFSMPIIGSILFTMSKFNCVAGHWWAGYIATYFFMHISYIFENQKSRNICKRNHWDQKKDDATNDKFEKGLSYPESVNLSNLFHYFIYNSSFIYNPGSMVRSKGRRNLTKTMYGLLYTVVCYYVMAFLFYQFILPESNLAVTSFINRNYAQVISSVGKLIIPINITWILFYDFWVFRCYLPMHGWFWGTEDAVYMADWWNSKTSTIFWTKWNCQMHLVFKNYFFIPLFEKGYSRLAASLAVVTASGILHEYIISVPFRTIYGLPFISMLLQVPLAHTTSYVSQKFGPKVGNIMVMSTYSLVYTISVPIIYYNSYY